MMIAMIPARMGSQRLAQKNLRLFNGIPLITHAIRRCKESRAFDEIWVNSEHEAFAYIAKQEGVQFHKRPEELANNQATSEQFIYEFLTKHACDWIVQVHSIAPLLQSAKIKAFVGKLKENACDVLLSCVLDQIECAYQNEPVNFTFDHKTNSQDLQPLQRITWPITGWRSETYKAAFEAGKTATYAGKVDFFPVDQMEGHVVKTEEDLRIAEAMHQVIVQMARENRDA